MNPQWVQAGAGLMAAYAALFAGIYAVVTRPIENRFADMAVTLKRIEDKLDRIGAKLDNHAERITRPEERRFIR